MTAYEFEKDGMGSAFTTGEEEGGEGMRATTVSLDKETFMLLVDYATEKSKKEVRRVSLSEAVRDVVKAHLMAGVIAR